MSIQITVNGRTENVDEGITLLGLLRHFGINPQSIAVEYNREVIDRNEFESIVLNDGDILEIITFIGGGHCERQHF